ncbi:type I-D CRISPR-associated protein Cas7/Csc2 [Pigmentibacter sp. JX0631]|uniref:type I-D CRISPR-associated protein Cas7/Csc2 n=1 Tax=Pigmentibacter sp. JX0631 TaxID=2976982 RepID=UPI002468E924|nr:type I-D CRISPR-associated protein Cas7/Csc2 [Pigmentibacter sp. JX0631]WGL60029.1 type I-D CRISPR-associated protein Cas7/Csc2 [Pigmentibacter sp. JX0631]
MNFLKNYEQFFSNEYSNYPSNKFISLFVLRETQSEVIFRTEGSGEPIAKEIISSKWGSSTYAVMSKRKALAAERRTGREVLRNHSLLKETNEGKLCALNSQSSCGKCLDCNIYGFAVGDAGCMKARVLSSDAFSILSIDEISDFRTFNAIYENGTMILDGENSQSLGSSEYIRPGVHILDQIVLHDVSQTEFLYVLMNVLNTNRYGAMSTRIGKMQNHLLGVAFSAQELGSNLQWLREIHEQLNSESRHPLALNEVTALATEGLPILAKQVNSQVSWVRGGDLNSMLNEFQTLAKTEKLIELFNEQTENYVTTFTKSASENGKKKPKKGDK